jgi:hypothetical protein
MYVVPLTVAIEWQTMQPIEMAACTYLPVALSV